MKSQFVSLLLIALGLTFSGGATAADATAKGGIFASEDADGGVVLSNIPSGDNQEAVVAAPDPTPPTAPEPRGAAPLQAATDPQAASADAPKDAREEYRDRLLQREEGKAVENTAVSRRYKMMDRETYRATVLGATPEAPTAPAKSQ